MTRTLLNWLIKKLMQEYRDPEGLGITESAKFPTNTIVCTASVANSDQVTYLDINESLGRHFQGDWGDLCEEDKLLNEEIYQEPETRVMGVYYSKQGAKLWIFTEGAVGERITTVLFPEDY